MKTCIGHITTCISPLEKGEDPMPLVFRDRSGGPSHGSAAVVAAAKFAEAAAGKCFV